MKKSNYQKRIFHSILVQNKNTYVYLQTSIQVILMLYVNYHNSQYFFIVYFQYRLESVHDGTMTGNKVNSKSWFHFRV